MSRYEPLARFLAAKKADAWDATFEEIEARLGRALPRSAYKYPAWWANQTGAGHSQTKGWRVVGWRTCGLDLERRRVRFERERAPERLGEELQPFIRGDDRSGRESLLKKACELTGIRDREALIDVALRVLIAREAGMRLAKLGGTMPDLRAPPRRRFN
ncbi:MAG TPA: type II toxin-antitoxin system VapB family antitoxin [Allosphingosinicella sp.]